MTSAFYQPVLISSAAAGDPLTVVGTGGSGIVLDDTGAVTLTAAVDTNITLATSGTGQIVFDGSFANISSETVSLPTGAVTEVDLTTFTAQTGTATVYVKGNGNGAAASNAMATFAVSKAAALSATGSIARLTSSPGTKDAEELVLQWDASSALSLQFSGANTYAGASTFEVSVFSTT